jgi:glutathione S-transferase
MPSCDTFAPSTSLPDWYPADPGARARVEQWLDWNQCRLSPAVVDIVLNSVFLGANGDPQAIERGQTKLRELMPILEGGLEGRYFIAGERPTILEAGVSATDFLAGNSPTIADLSLASSIFQLSLAKIVPAGKSTESWFRRMSEIDGFRRSLPQG